MSNTSGNFLTAIINFLLSLFGKKKPQTPEPSPTPVPENIPNEPAQPVTSRVLLVVYDPSMEDGQKLSQKLGWYRTDDLIAGFMDDIQQNSHGMARYEIVQRYEVDEFPAKVDGFRYTPQSYMDVLRGAASPHMPQEVDYQAILTQFNILSRVSKSEIDEVWVFAFPHAGFYESTMGGAGAFWCNAPPLRDTAACPRRFVLMGFSYERYIGEMLESFGHRTESILEKTFEKLQGDANLWKRFIRYEQTAPGKAACGNIHFAPNSVRDYDWNNPTTVKSECYDWLLNFPNFKGDIRDVTSAEWGRGEIRAHHQWWLKHLPHAAGRQNGIHNNWWQYVMDVNNVKV